jgi:hypothetical protein
MCTICQSSVQNVIFHCAGHHIFHKPCLDTWAEASKIQKGVVTCPNCNEIGSMCWAPANVALHDHVIELQEQISDLIKQKCAREVEFIKERAILTQSIHKLELDKFGLQQTIDYNNFKFQQMRSPLKLYKEVKTQTHVKIQQSDV